MKDQKDKSKKISNDGESEKIYSTLDIKPTEFVGFETLESKSQILAIIKDNKIQEKISGAGEFEIITDKTPFYAEKGGQVGDTGKQFLIMEKLKYLILNHHMEEFLFIRLE